MSTPASKREKVTGDVSLVTGFPAFTARRLTRKLLESDARETLYLLARDKFRVAAEEFLSSLPAAHKKRVTVLAGDVCDMDLGLGGGEYRALAAELTAIHHTAAVYYLGAKRELVERVNVDGPRAILELAGE